MAQHTREGQRHRRSALILYGSETGNSQDVAAELGRLAERLHFVTRVITMDSVDLSVLSKFTVVVFALSTAGQGEFPKNARKFWKSLLRKKLPPGFLGHVTYTTFGLGDSSYPKYNFAARKLHKRLGQLGAREVYPRGEADDRHDDGIDGTFLPWSIDFQKHLLSAYPLEEGVLPIPSNVLLPPKFLLQVIEDIHKPSSIDIIGLGDSMAHSPDAEMASPKPRLPSLTPSKRKKEDSESPSPYSSPLPIRERANSPPETRSLPSGNASTVQAKAFPKSDEKPISALRSRSMTSARPPRQKPRLGPGLNSDLTSPELRALIPDDEPRMYTLPDPQKKNDMAGTRMPMSSFADYINPGSKALAINRSSKMKNPDPKSVPEETTKFTGSHLEDLGLPWPTPLSASSSKPARAGALKRAKSDSSNNSSHTAHASTSPTTRYSPPDRPSTRVPFFHNHSKGDHQMDSSATDISSEEARKDAYLEALFRGVSLPPFEDFDANKTACKQIRGPHPDVEDPKDTVLAPNDDLDLPDAFTMTIIDNQRITPEDHWQDVREITIRLVSEEGSGLMINPGDQLVIYPKNFPEDVQTLIDLMDWQDVADKAVKFVYSEPHFFDEDVMLGIPEDMPKVEDGTTLRDLLLNSLDITAIPNRHFFHTVSTLCSDRIHRDRLEEFGSAKYTDEYYDYATRPRRTILEVLQDFPSIKIPYIYIGTIFPVIRGRPYSISQIINENFDGARRIPGKNEYTLQLLIAIVKYRTILKKIRHGLCSRYIASLPVGTDIKIELNPDTKFFRMAERMPQAPIICIAPGTGLAPCRSLIWHRAIARDIEMGEIGECYLFYGGRNKDKDFFYKEEWEDNRLATRVFTAFSRDQKEKRYVQDVIREEGELIQSLLQRKPTPLIFICGSSGNMPKAVRAALLEVMLKWGHLKARGDEAKAWCEDNLSGLEKRGLLVQETW